MDKHKNELTGSFALNALGDAERDDVLRHAEDSEAVREELDALQETAALLGLSAKPVAPPARVKANIMAAIRNTPQLPPAEAQTAVPAHHEAEAVSPAHDPQPLQRAEPLPAPPVPAETTAKPKNQRMFALAAGVLLVAAGALGGVVVNQNAQQQELEERLAVLSTQQSELTRILTAADVRSKTQEIDDGARVTLAYSAAEGAMAVTTSGLPALPGDKGYELWLISGTGAVSAGMLDGTQSDGLVMVAGSMEGVTHFGITVEPATGSPAPTTDPILVQEL
ncbi:anti-sigma factor domain-containing protein [Paeniglutamicibacter gangotriensis]|uniref:Regulator of SigK n=1 Tax=Paeniglutamicibacter gangotriensis Lz1y TaxID=1276920 RepID=M7MY56_9MICC|nr:anti-sigma factor [Paeniglutamicibacter gangotriensis]EMQ99885.1 putative anti-sigmaE protein [Paeniglutamicibacter gangotriensis Lz1y]